MIRLTRLNGKEFYVNSDMIEFLESTPDTVITLSDDKKLVVKETITEVVDRIINFRSKVSIYVDNANIYKEEV